MPSTNPPILDIRGLRKKFGDAEVLRGIDLSVQAQELVFVIGPSGSGKSTLLRCCNRLEEPSAGSIHIDGADIMARSTDINAMRRRIGMVFQSFNLYPHMTALGHVALALRRVMRLPRAEGEARACAALERVGLADRADHYPHQLSGGQQQRVAIARAIAGDPALILADEPTGNLDSLMARQVMDLLEQINEMGTTIVLVTHDPELARRAQRNVHVVDGVVIDSAPYERRIPPEEARAGASGAVR
jgi:ABC-type polar amino acid transport system ATPase subunit